MKVPAWPMPIHQTKLAMAKPQPTGMFTPHTPTPLINNQVTAALNSINSEKAMAKPKSQVRVRGLRT